MSLETIGEVRGLLNSIEGSLIGVGITAFPRIVPAYFRDSYQILSLKKTLDLPLLRKRVPVFSLEEELGEPVQEEGWTSARLLAHPHVQRVLEGLKGPIYLLLYQGYEDLEAMSLEKGWVLLANRASLRRQVGDRRFLQDLLGPLGLPTVPGGTFSMDDLRGRNYGSWEKDLGPRFVIQLNEIQKGGGRGTFFVHSPGDYQSLLKRLEENTWRGTGLSSVTVRQYITGCPASVALCLLRQGVLVSGLQRQLIDLPYCKDLPERGIFCGHVWGDDLWPPPVMEEAQGQALRIAEHLSAMGYRGIAGIDYIVDEEDSTVYALEINPRLTGVFPMLSFLHMRRGLIPMEIFHLLEFLGVPYTLDVEDQNQQYRKSFAGGQILLMGLDTSKTISPTLPQAGLYVRDGDEAVYVRGTAEFEDLVTENEFLLVEGPPDTMGRTPQIADPLSRLGRMLFSGTMASSHLKMADGLLRKMAIAP